MKLEAEPGGQVQQPAPGRPGWGWQKAQGTGAIGLLALFALAMARFGVDPFFLIMAAPFVVALLLRLRFRRTGTVLIGVFSVALFAMNAGFVIDEIQHPEAGFDFIFPTGFTLALLIGIITAVPAYREVRRGRSGSAAPKAIPAAALVLLIAFVG